MKKKPMIAKVLFLLLSTVVLFSFFTVMLFASVARDYFVHREKEQLQNKAIIITNIMKGFFSDDVHLSAITSQFSTDRALWNADVYIIDIDGQLFMGSQIKSTGYTLEERFIDYATNNEAMQDVIMTKKGTYIFVTEPVKNQNGQRSATVILIKPVVEAYDTMNLLSGSLLLSAIIVLAFMLPYTFFSIRRILLPLKQMGTVANAMADGNFQMVALDGSFRELSQLSGALNHMSKALGNSIYALRMERNRLRKMLNEMREGVVAVTSENEIEMYNASAIRLLDIQQEEHITNEQLLQQVLGEHFKKSLTHYRNVSFELKRADRLIHVEVIPVHGDQGQYDSAMAVLYDATEARRLEQTQNEYVSNVSHEIRTPLTAIRALIEPMSEGMVKDEATRARYYGIILRETMRLTRLITDLMELSRLRSGNLVIEKSNIELDVLLTQIYEKFSFLAQEKGISLTLQKPEKNGFVYSNPDRVEQCLVALLDNAMKFTPKGGQITILVKDQGDHVLLSVRDTGCGIPEEDLPHVFDRFYQVDKSHNMQGSGLGLAIIHLILEGMGEKIRVFSVLGKGSTFTFTLHRLPNWRNQIEKKQR